MKLNIFKVLIVIVIILSSILLVLKIMSRNGIFLGNKYCEYNGNHPIDLIGYPTVVTYNFCNSCGTKMQFGTTKQDKLCTDCANKLSRCAECGNKLK